jgi:threonine dehydratase
VNQITLPDVFAAAERIRGHVYRSPLHHSTQLSRLCSADIHCKLDHMQITGSFKERGAVNKLLSLEVASRRKGVICASAGNHALAVAYHAARLSIPVTVCMPRWAPLIKVKNCRNFGADVRLTGETFADAYDAATLLSRETGMTFIPGFDDPAIVAGAATAGLEILEDLPDVDAVIVPVGGAGLIAGIGLVVKNLRPAVRIIGVEPEHCPSLSQSLAAGKVVKVASSPTLADGLAVQQVGQVPFDLITGPLTLVDHIELVSEADIALAVLRLLELEKMVVEGAGAASLAAAMRLPKLGLRGKKVAILLCGGNIDVTVLNKIIERGLAADGRLCRVTCLTSDRPGSLARMTAIFAATGASVSEIFHDRHFGPADVAQVAITAVLETRDAAHVAEIHAALKGAGITVATN